MNAAATVASDRRDHGREPRAIPSGMNSSTLRLVSFRRSSSESGANVIRLRSHVSSYDPLPARVAPVGGMVATSTSPSAMSSRAAWRRDAPKNRPMKGRRHDRDGSPEQHPRCDERQRAEHRPHWQYSDACPCRAAGRVAVESGRRSTRVYDAVLFANRRSGARTRTRPGSLRPAPAPVGAPSSSDPRSGCLPIPGCSAAACSPGAEATPCRAASTPASAQEPAVVDVVGSAAPRTPDGAVVLSVDEGSVLTRRPPHAGCRPH